MAITIPDISLNDGTTIPQLGFGVFQIEPKDTVAAVTTALETGYRHIDTAEMYGNEAEVGEAVRMSGLDRGSVYVTSKLNNGFHRPDDARKAFDSTLAALKMDYIDLFLIHWPLPTLYDGDYVSTWKVLEEFQRDGRARSIGVSNFQAAHLDRMVAEADVVPAVNQIEAHPYFTNDEVRAYGREHNIITEAWRHRAGQGAGRPDGGRHRRAARPDPGAGGAPLARAARRHHLPEVDHPEADRGEHPDLRLRAGRHGDGADHRAEQGRGRAAGPEPGHLRLRPPLT